MIEMKQEEICNRKMEKENNGYQKQTLIAGPDFDRQIFGGSWSCGLLRSGSTGRCGHNVHWEDSLKVIDFDGQRTFWRLVRMSRSDTHS